MLVSIALSQLQRAIPGSRLVGDDVSICSYCTDSRVLKPGDVFFAIRGKHFDGHCFIDDVIARQAAALVVEKEGEYPLAYLCVDDVVAALGELARLVREAFAGTVVALTGSAGKTTTKELLNCVLKHTASVHATQGNFNNELGVPYTLLALPADKQYAVIEMGAAKAGDIAYLMRIVNPDIGILLNALPAHIEGFGSVERVAQTKFDVIAQLREKAWGIVNLDAPFSAQWLSQARGKKILGYSLQGAAAVSCEQLIRAKDIQLSGLSSKFCVQYQDQIQNFQLQLPGRHNIANAMAAIACAVVCGMALRDIAEALRSFQAVAGRMASFQGIRGAQIIDDSYNANPDAMQQAIDVLSGCSGRRILVIGDMAELGEQEKMLHAEVGKYALGRVDYLFTCGRLSAHSAAAFGAAANTFQSQEELIEALSHFLNEGDVVLIKGSRASGMDSVVTALRDTSNHYNHLGAG